MRTPSSLFIAATLTVVTSFALPRLAMAQKSEAAIAEALFQDGRRLMALKKFDEACPKFEESYRLVKKLGTLLNLGTCHDGQGRSGSAWGELTEAVTLAKDTGEKDRETYARKLLTDLDARLSKVVLNVSSPPPGLEVKLDGRVISAAAFGTPIPVDPGAHTVEAAAPGYAPWTNRVEAAKGPASQAIEVPALTALPSDAPPPTTAAPPKPVPPPAPVDEGSTGQLAAGIVVGSVGLVSVAIGSVFGVMTFSKQDESEAHCVETRCDQAGVDLREEASTTGLVSTITFIGGGAAVVGGLILMLTSGGSSAPDQAALTPFVGPDGAGVTFRGQF